MKTSPWLGGTGPVSATVMSMVTGPPGFTAAAEVVWLTPMSPAAWAAVGTAKMPSTDAAIALSLSIGRPRRAFAARDPALPMVSLLLLLAATRGSAAADRPIDGPRYFQSARYATTPIVASAGGVMLLRHLRRDPSYFVVAGISLDREMERLRGLPVFAGGPIARRIPQLKVRRARSRP